jgi:hypothetical protein
MHISQPVSQGVSWSVSNLFCVLNGSGENVGDQAIGDAARDEAGL